MNLDQELILYAKIIAVVAMLNWLIGDRSFAGNLLEIRKEPMWLRMRWMGLGSAVSCFAIEREDSIILSYAALAGSLLLLIGTARRRFRFSKRIQSISSNSNHPN